MAEVRSYVAGEALATLRFLKVIYGNISWKICSFL